MGRDTNTGSLEEKASVSPSRSRHSVTDAFYNHSDKDNKSSEGSKWVETAKIVMNSTAHMGVPPLTRHSAICPLCNRNVELHTGID